MILKASQRSGAKQLALHLLSPENEHVTVHDMRGFISDDVVSAFKEMQAIAKGTQCQKFMFSLSLSPPPDEAASIDDFEKAIDLIEEELKMKNQPRAIIFHEKEGRRHCHAVWSRIDGRDMKAIKLPYFKQRLNGIAKELYIEHGWDLPKGFISRELRDPRNFTLAEWQQAKRHKIDPREIKSVIQQCWKVSDNTNSFKYALQENGFFLAKGDKRGFVALDWRGEVYSLSRALGVKAKELKTRLGNMAALPTVDDTKAEIAQKYSELHKRFGKELTIKHEFIIKPLHDRRNALLHAHKQARMSLKEHHTQRQQKEQVLRQQKIRKGLLGLWDFLTGKSRKQYKTNEAETLASAKRDRDEKETLVLRQLQERRNLQEQLQQLRKEQRQEKIQLSAELMNSLPDDIRNRVHAENPDITPHMSL